MACAKASVVSDIPELSFVSSSGAGISFACGSAPSLTRAMSAMMTSESRLSMGAQAREASRDATWESVAARFVQVLMDASGRRT
jgi:glycosyltransferase involved in cell wall biosynthesis